MIKLFIRTRDNRILRFKASCIREAMEKVNEYLKEKTLREVRQDEVGAKYR